MKRQAPSSKLSDRELSDMLKGMREDVAAPPAFRGRVLQRLAQEGLIAAAPAPVALPWGARVAAWVSLPRLGLLAGAACALALVLLPSTRTPQVAVAPVIDSAPAQAPAVVASAATARVRKLQPALAAKDQTYQGEPMVARAASVVIEKEDAPVSAESAPAQSETVAIGSAPAPRTSQALGLAAASASGSQAPSFGAASGAVGAGQITVAATDKPTVIVIEPTPTPMVKALAGDSEVRNNVVRASRGESALVIFRLQSAGAVHIDIHDRLGRPVAVLKDASLQPGTYQLRWAGASDQGGMAASGIYELRIQAPGYETRHKLMLVK